MATKKRRRWSFFDHRTQGLVFLIYKNETKRALLPNEVTSVDTVRALFVRSFPDNLNMAYLESNHRKIYVLDQQTNLYYELEELKDVKDRAVLKIYDTEPARSDGSRSPSRSPKSAHSSRTSYLSSGHESDSSVRSAPPGLTNMPRSPVRAPVAQRPFTTSHDFSSKSASLPVQPNYAYQQQMMQYSHYGNAALGSSQRHSVAYLPEPANFTQGGIPQSRSYHDYYDNSSRSGSATPTASDMETHSNSSLHQGSVSSGSGRPHGSMSRMDKMEVQLMNLAALVQTAVTRDGSRPGSARSSTSINSNTNSAHSSLSDLSSATPQPMYSVDMHNSLKALKGQARELRDECRNIRRMQMTFADSMRETINVTYRKIKEVIHEVPSASDLPIRSQRFKVNEQVGTYKVDSSSIENDLKDLERTVEDIRNDVLNKRCRVNRSEVDTMALALSNISRNLGDLKAKFPLLQDSMKTVLVGEVEVVVQEEKFLKDEPHRLENALKRCKKLSGTLYTLKRLSAAQEDRVPAVPNINFNGEENGDSRKNVLDNIQAMVPNHEARLSSVQAAEEAMERKKKFVTNADAMRFEKSLELAHRQLRETNGDAKQVNGILKQQQQMRDEEGQKVNLPLTTDTTKRLSQVASPEKERKELRGDAPFKPPQSQEQDKFESSASFTYSSTISMKANESPSPPSSNNSNKSSPTKLPTPLTSTPISNTNSIGRSHVTFNSNVIEIRDCSPTTRTLNDVADGKKKIPPPPPPRRSSRLVSPQDAPQSGRSFSPPAYENIENLNIDTSGDNKTEKQRPRPLNKFQHELAAGIYANLNRPDLQGQKTSPSLVVRDPVVRESATGSVSSDSDSTCSGDSQSAKSKDGVVLREKKTPPPPPVRRTSALSNIQKQTIPEDEPPSPKDGSMERPLSNGEVRRWEKFMV